jgi:outer membrane protein TolC
MPLPHTFSHTRRSGDSVLHAILACFVLTALPLSAVDAQAPAAPGGAAPGTGEAGAGTAAGAGPAGGGPSPGVSSGLPGASTAGQILTLPGVVARVLGNNSGLVIARQRLQRAQESINQVNAQLRPQFRLNGNDTYSSYPAFPATLPVPTITNPSLPDSGQIPTVTDLANNFTTGFIGTNGLSIGGGGGTAVPAVASGSAAPAVAGGTAGVAAPTAGGVGGTTAPASGANGAAPGAGPGTGAPGTTGGAAPATGNGAAPATGNGAAPATGGAAPATGNGTTAPAGMTLSAYPPIVADYVADLRTLLEPPASQAEALRVRVGPSVPNGDAADGTQQAEARPGPKAPGDGTDPTATGTTTTTTSLGRRDTYAAGANVTQYLDVYGLGPTARNAEKDVRDFYALDVTRLQNETALAAKNLFFNVLYAQALVATQQEQVNYAQENVRITGSRLRNGVVSRFDLLTAQAALATAQQQLTAAQDEYQLTQSELSYLLGTDPDQPQTLQSPPLPPLDQTVDVRQSTQIALRQRPELGQASRNVDNAQKQVRLAGSSLLPTFGLVGAAETTSNASTVTPSNFATISAQVALPLDDGGQTRSRVRSAQVNVQTQAVTRQQIQAGVALEVRQATINVRNAQAEIGSAQVSVTSSQEALRLARERYEAGLGTFLDVLNALAQLATARTNLANAQYFYQSSLALLVRAMGGR